MKKNAILYITTPNGSSPHFSNNKIEIEELRKHLIKFKINEYGWNNIKPITTFLPRIFNYIPPKFLKYFNFIWEKLINNMKFEKYNSKYILIIARK